MGQDTYTSSPTLIKAEFFVLVFCFFFSHPRIDTILPVVIRHVVSGWDGSPGD